MTEIAVNVVIILLFISNDWMTFGLTEHKMFYPIEMSWNKQQLPYSTRGINTLFKHASFT